MFTSILDHSLISPAALCTSHGSAKMAGKQSLIVRLPFSSSSASTINAANYTACGNGRRAGQDPASAMKQVVPSKIIRHFSQSQLALALAIQKAKPETLSTNGKPVSLFSLFTYLSKLACRVLSATTQRHQGRSASLGGWIALH